MRSCPRVFACQVIEDLEKLSGCCLRQEVSVGVFDCNISNPEKQRLDAPRTLVSAEEIPSYVEKDRQESQRGISCSRDFVNGACDWPNA